MTAAPPRVLGAVTRGTTARGRLRRFDRWLVGSHPALLRRPDLLVVDLGFGATPVTTLDLARVVRAVNPTAHVVGLDVDPDRVARARTHDAADGHGAGVEFAVGGFELRGLRPHLVRAFNVLRQYDEADVAPAWQRLTSGLAPGGLAVDGTCDETGRCGAWVSLRREGPQALTLVLPPDEPPSRVAARLPKVLIHHNVAGEPIHDLLAGLDAHWRRHAALNPFGPRQRVAAAAADLRADGWPVADGASRWRRGEVTLAWAAVAPRRL